MNLTYISDRKGCLFVIIYLKLNDVSHTTLSLNWNHYSLSKGKILFFFLQYKDLRPEKLGSAKT